MDPPLVLIDTCMWVSFFNAPHSAEKGEIDGLLDDDRALLIGPILAEILCGFRRAEQANWAASFLRGMHWLDPNWVDWKRASELHRDLKIRGHDVPLTDLVAAAVALRIDAEVYTVDPHFDLLPNVKRYRPE
jgi:predicted nucleic acid-binding protein